MSKPYYLIGGVRYEIPDFTDPDVMMFVDLYEQTGLSPERAEELLAEVEAAQVNGGRLPNGQSMVTSREHMTVLAVQVWIARRAAGEDLTVKEAIRGVRLSEMEPHNDDPEPVEDPTDGPEVSGPDVSPSAA